MTTRRDALKVRTHWGEVFKDAHAAALRSRLPAYLAARRWFGGKARTLKSATLLDTVPVSLHREKSWLALVRVHYLDGDTELYQLPMAFARGARARAVSRDTPHLVIAPLHIQRSGESGVLYDAIGHMAFGRALFDLMLKKRRTKGAAGVLAGHRLPFLRTILGDSATPPDPIPAKAEQSNSALVFDQLFILKLFRKLDIGLNPDLEINRFLTRHKFPHVPSLAGYLEYRGQDGDTISLGLLSGFVPNVRDGWTQTLGALHRYYDRIQRLSDERQEVPVPKGSLCQWTSSSLPRVMRKLIGAYLETARLLGLRTVQMHLALASDSEDKEFAPESFTPASLRSLHQSSIRLAKRNLQLLRNHLKDLPASIRPDARRVAEAEGIILQRLRGVPDHGINTLRIRTHGDYHLGQILSADGDFVIVDFEGEPSRPLEQRRMKRSPLRDVAGMIRSFHYAAFSALQSRIESGAIPAKDRPRFEAWARAWHHGVSGAFLEAYLANAGTGSFLPQTDAGLTALLDAELLDKAIYELGYELNNRPDWVGIPVHGILQLLK